MAVGAESVVYNIWR